MVIFSLLDKLTPLKLTGTWSTESFGFVYGIILANVLEIYKKYAERLYVLRTLFLFSASIITGFLYLKFKQIYFTGDYLLKIILGIVILLLILQLMIKFEIGNKVTSFLGEISYEVYLLHGFVFNWLCSAEYIKNSGILIWLVILLTILGAAFINCLSKNILSFLKSRVYNNLAK